MHMNKNCYHTHKILKLKFYILLDGKILSCIMRGIIKEINKFLIVGKAFNYNHIINILKFMRQLCKIARKII